MPFLALFLIVEYAASVHGIVCAQTGFDFVLLCLGVQLLLAAGCVLNDICDYNIDKINKPNTHIVGRVISLKASWAIYYILVAITAILSIYITSFIFPEWALISFFVFLMSISYDYYFKRTPLFGNILMGILTAMIPITLLIFYGGCVSDINDVHVDFVIWFYAIFPFLIIVPRELSLDISDMEGDRKDGCRTLPLLIGERSSRIVVVVMILFIILVSIIITLLFPFMGWTSLIIDPLLMAYIYQFLKCKSRIEYIKAGRFLWFIMILGAALTLISAMIQINPH